MELQNFHNMLTICVKCEDGPLQHPTWTMDIKEIPVRLVIQVFRIIRERCHEEVFLKSFSNLNTCNIFGGWFCTSYFFTLAKIPTHPCTRSIQKFLTKGYTINDGSMAVFMEREMKKHKAIGDWHYLLILEEPKKKKKRFWSHSLSKIKSLRHFDITY